MTGVVDQIRDVVTALLDGNVPRARDLLVGIDQGRLVQERAIAYKAIWGPEGSARRAKRHIPGMPRDRVSERRKLEVFKRDHFVCRYSHCRRRTIYLPVLRALSNTFPDVLPRHHRWKPLHRHILYWSYSTSLEHHVAFAHGGSSQADNLITACYECNDLKNRLTAEDLGWQLSSSESTAWDGLYSTLPGLRSAGLL